MSKVSVIVPVYNAEKYLEQCISSIANQTLKDIEIIAVDDGSIDNSLMILDNLSLKYRGKLKVLTKENGGTGSARNVGIDNATGEFIKFVDADDYLKLNILEKMYSIAKDYRVSLVRGNYQTILGPIKLQDKCSFSDINENILIYPTIKKDYIITETPGVGNKLISRDLIGDLRFPEQTKWEDLAIMPVIVASSDKIFHLDEPVYNYRAHMNTTLSDFINKIPQILDIIKCLDILKMHLEERNLYDKYQKQFESLYILHTLFRVENAMLWVNFPYSKKKVVISSLIAILDSKYPNWQQNEIFNLYQQKNSLFSFDMKRLKHYINDDARSVDLKTAEDNIGRALK